MRVLTAAEMREVDRLSTDRFAVPSLTLMENAGRRVSEFVMERFSASATLKVVVLCGKGNNGGDGLVAARYLREHGIDPEVCLFAAAEGLRGDAAANLKRWQATGGDLTLVESAEQWEVVRAMLGQADIIVDALLGTGLSGPAEGLLGAVIADVNAATRCATAARPHLVLAVDMPSGLPSDGEPATGPVVQAHATVTFTAPKPGQLVSRDAAAVGALHVREIGSPMELVEQIATANLRLIEPLEFEALPLVRRADVHKGSFGHALLVAGSLGKSGAAILAGRGALRAGAGLVTVATPAPVFPIVACGQPELMTESLLATETGGLSLANLEYGRFAAMLDGKAVLAVGPGLSTHPETQQLVRTIVRESSLPIILDADGLNAYVGKEGELRAHSSPYLVLTPHPGEMARLLGVSSIEVQANRLATALRAAAAWNAYIVLKGFHTIVASPDGRAFVSTSGNAGLAKGGTGDVLTGVLAGITAEFGTEDWLRKLALGVYLHGRAAELAAARIEPAGLLASEIADHLPAALRHLLADLARHAS
jgi:ADP-dependent NAD(P)H-hydrate dehydratase / NAD(P)H-hydrate epimerase